MTERLESLHDFFQCQIELILSADFGSSHKNYREKIRTHLIDHVRSAKVTENESLADLEKIPFLPSASLSISHCKEIGGFLFSQIEGFGFDVEMARRVRPETIGRVSSKKEVEESPSPGHLWVAKEAAYKCLYRNGQPQHVGKVIPGDWQSEKGGDFSFTVPDFSITGLCWQQEELVYAVAKRSAGTL